MKQSIWKGGGLLLMAILVFGCASRPPRPAEVSITITASGDVNPNPAGRPSPIVFKMFELTSPASFQSADFFSLDENPGSVLGADSLGQLEFIIKPGEIKDLDRTLQQQTGYLGLFGAYRDLENASWRALVEIPPHVKSRISIVLGAKGISATLKEE